MTNTSTSNEAPKTAGFLQPHPGTSVMQMAMTVSAGIIALTSVAIAGAAIMFAVKSGSDERNARLVEIGVAVLRVDPEKEGHVEAARKWALDLIDANAGGVRFSKEARAALEKKPLQTRSNYSFDPGYTDYEYNPAPSPPQSRPRQPQVPQSK